MWGGKLVNYGAAICGQKKHQENYWGHIADRKQTKHNIVGGIDPTEGMHLKIKKMWSLEMTLKKEILSLLQTRLLTYLRMAKLCLESLQSFAQHLQDQLRKWNNTSHSSGFSKAWYENGFTTSTMILSLLMMITSPSLGTPELKEVLQQLLMLQN